jgi:hypothetical protein
MAGRAYGVKFEHNRVWRPCRLHTTNSGIEPAAGFWAVASQWPLKQTKDTHAAGSGHAWRRHRTGPPGDPKKTKKSPEKPKRLLGAQEYSGDVLLSHTVSRAVPSALWSLTSEFGMGSGVTSTLWSPETDSENRKVLRNEISLDASSWADGLIHRTLASTNCAWSSRTGD